MSSFQRTRAVASETTKYQKVTTPTYYDDDVGNDIPIPFIYSNHTLDIHIQDNVQVDLIDDGDSPGENTDYQCTVLGGTGLVLNLGDKMVEWLNNYLDNQYGDNYVQDSCAVYNSGVVTKSQFVFKTNVESGGLLGSDVDDSTYAITDAPPIGKYSSNFILGDEPDNYRTVWIFKSPLVISFTVSGSTKYLTLFTNFSGND